MEKSEFRIVEKPENFSFDDLYQMIYNAHATNRDVDLKINTHIHNGDQLKQHLGDQATTFVLFENGQPVGTVSTRVQEGEGHFLKGLRITYLMHLAILPEYTGKGYGTSLCNKVEDYGRQNDTDAIVLHVVDRNPAKSFYKRNGFEPITFLPRKSLKQNSVIMVKWLKPCSAPLWKRNLYYCIKRVYGKLKYRYK